ncbi:MAG: ribosomal protein S18-alanine N-acetyltransferase [Gammaproteobacteria bacterium]|nr:ribosomal protein S18-alanine N-acetyltransferase [Gammaproteobacteria bacterium]MDH3559963.1 ribosomal protein S18-alanine N-acetyltransferase [Gammaproteobacteria bacterium]
MSAILNEPALSFQPMQEADLTDVVEIERRNYPYPWTRTIFGDCLRAGYSCWVCERQGIIEGYGVISVAAGESHLLNLCVRAEAQQQGIGRKLLKHLISIAHHHGAEVIFLEVRPSNRAALELYSKSGFNELGVRKDYYPAPGGREDALILARML